MKRVNNSKQLISKTCAKGINANNANTEDLITLVKKTLNKYITDDTVMAKINVVEVAKVRCRLSYADLRVIN